LQCVGSLSVLTFFSWVTFIGGVAIMVGGLGYVFCVVRGESPHIGERVDEGYEPTADAEPSATPSTSLFGSYQKV
jgi:hypothetical protein